MSGSNGFLTAGLIGKINAYLCKAVGWGYNGNLKLLSALLYDADIKLFRGMLHSTHCIHQLLPQLKFMPTNCAVLLTVLLFSLLPL